MYKKQKKVTENVKVGDNTFHPIVTLKDKDWPNEIIQILRNQMCCLSYIVLVGNSVNGYKNARHLVGDVIDVLKQIADADKKKTYEDWRKGGE